MKFCKRCATEKPLEEFKGFSVASGKEYKRSWCVQCTSDSATDKRVLKKYGVTPEQYKELLAKQENVCAICKTPYAGSYPDSKTKRFAVDHDHKTNAVRGLLCSCCNTGLGQFKDNIELLTAAIAYLEANNGTQERNQERHLENSS